MRKLASNVSCVFIMLRFLKLRACPTPYLKIYELGRFSLVNYKDKLMQFTRANRKWRDISNSLSECTNKVYILVNIDFRVKTRLI